MMDARTFFLASRVWWSMALVLGPVLGALARQLFVGIFVTIAMLGLALVLFDTDRRWWSDDVRQVQGDAERSRREARILMLWSAVALAAGLIIAFVRPWGSG